MKENPRLREIWDLPNKGERIAEIHDADSSIFLCPNGDLNPEALAGTSTSS